MNGKDLKILRQLHGLNTQQHLADYLGVAVRTIGNHEASERLPKKLRDYYNQHLNVEKYEEIKQHFEQKRES